MCPASRPECTQTFVVRYILTLLAGAALLILGLAFSVLLFAVVAVLGLAVWGYLWWKTRNIRQAMQSKSPGGQVIDGEAIVIKEDSANT